MTKVYVLISKYNTSDNLYDMTGETVTELLEVFDTLEKAKQFVENKYKCFASSIEWYANKQNNTCCYGKGSWAKFYKIIEKELI